MKKYTPLEYKAEYKKGRLQKLIFKNVYEYENACYELEEEYGKGYIDYYLYLIQGDTRISVPLEEIEETRELKRIDFKEKNNVSRRKR